MALAKQLRLAADPRNLSLLYAHLARSNKTLSSDFLAAISSDGYMSQAEADRLYDVHIQQADYSERVASVIYQLEGQVAKVADAVAQSGADSKGHTEQLGALTGELGAVAADADPSVGALLEGVAGIVKSVADANARLETQLAESSDEISFLRESIDSIQQEAMTDPLTGVRNRKTFDESIQSTVERANETGEPLTMILADIDHFKRFNDRWGHQTGDQVLRLVAEMMKANVKGKDILARYGGEEFAVILPATQLEHGVSLADRIREAIGKRILKKRRTNESMGAVTMSMGVAEFKDTDTVETLIARTDQCLYAAKHLGRDRVVSDEMDYQSALADAGTDFSQDLGGELDEAIAVADTDDDENAVA